MRYPGFLHAIAAAFAALVLALPLAAQHPMIGVENAFARVSTPMSRSGAVFFDLINVGDADDRLVGASSPDAARVELHTHVEDADGVMRMVEVEDGFTVPAGGTHALERGGDHVMLMGLTGSFEAGSMVEVTLQFELSGEVTLRVPVETDARQGGGSGG